MNIGIYGYGNLGRGVEAAIAQNKDMELVAQESLCYDITVNGNQNIKNLFAMTPYYWKTSQDDVKKLDGLESLHTEIDVIFEIYQKI